MFQPGGDIVLPPPLMATADLAAGLGVGGGLSGVGQMAQQNHAHQLVLDRGGEQLVARLIKVFLTDDLVMSKHR